MMARASIYIHRLFLTLCVGGIASGLHADTTTDLKGFCQYQTSDEFYNQWQALTFPNINQHTQYEWAKTNGYCHVHAIAQASASGLIYKTKLDLAITPVIHWSWKISRTLQKGDSSNKAGDDYAARIYIAFESNTKQLSWLDKFKRLSVQLLYNETLPGNVINYIWANKLTMNQSIPNAYIDSSQMIAIQSGNENAGTWQLESRNVLDDYKRLFGETPPQIIGIAIMTDTDNTGETAEAWYGPIYFSEN